MIICLTFIRIIHIGKIPFIIYLFTWVSLDIIFLTNKFLAKEYAMKRSTILFAVSLFLLLSFRILPQETAFGNSSNKEACFETLQQGLVSDNLGLQAGCTYMVGEVGCQKSVICLLKILHNDPSEELRILAALSLYKIGDSRGIYAIKQAIKYDNSKRVQRMCEIFYKAYNQVDTGREINVALN